jgi:hypothetical protein
MKPLGILFLLAISAFTQISVPLAANKWLIITCDPSGDYCYTNDGAAPLSNAPGGALQFTWPKPSVGTAGYLTTVWKSPLTGYTSLVLTVSSIPVSGTPIFAYDTAGNPCVYAPHVRPYIQFLSDGGSGETFANEEWWANDPYSYELDLLGTATITVPLTDLSVWSNEAGQFADSSPTETAAFQTVLAHPGQIGMNFGGGCFFGHGVYVEGGVAQFQVVSLELE